MAHDVTSVIDAVSPGEPVLAVGHSMGGAALLLAEQARPGLLRAGWAFEPIIFPGGSNTREPSMMSEAARRRRARFPNRDEAYERYGSRPPLNLFDPRSLRAYVDHGFVDTDDGEVTLACRPEDEASVFEYHSAGGLEALDEIGVPFAVAASDDGGPPALAVIEAASERPHVDLVEFESTSHFGPLEAPERTAASAGDYLGRLG